MICFLEYGYAARGLLLVFFFLALVFQMALALLRGYQRRGRKLLCLDGIILAAGIFLLVKATALHTMGIGTEQTTALPPLPCLPYYFLWFAGAFIGVYAVCGFLFETKQSRKTLNRNAIKTALDNIPVGICFFDRNGLPRLCNRAMHRIAFELTGTPPQGAAKLRNAVAAASLKNDPAAALWENEQPKYLGIEGRIWQITEEKLKDRYGHSHLQFIALDVTALHEKKTELEEANRALQQIGEEVKALSHNAVDIMIHQEILKMRMKIHDGIGRNLILTRRALAGELPLTSLASVIETWQAALDGAAAPDEVYVEEDMLLQLFKAAADCGIEIKLTGRLPKDRKAAYLIVSAVRECVTNAVKYAKAKEVKAEIINGKGTFSVTVTNDGIPPKGRINEGGGLSTLRHRIESAGGEMAVAGIPEFALFIKVPAYREEMTW